MIAEEDRAQLMADLPDDGTGNWLNAVARLGWQITPHCPGQEFEIKYAPVTREIGHTQLGHYVRQVKNAELPADLVMPDWLSFRTMVSEYWLVDGVEWSLQRLSSGERLKRKVHTVYTDRLGRPPLIQSRETFMSAPEQVASVVGGLANSIGTLQKRQAKAFLVKLDAGVVFNLTESRCTSAAAEQIQLELEYSCHLHRGTGAPASPCRPVDIRELLWEVDGRLAALLRAASLTPTTELKQDFVRAQSESSRYR